MHSSIRDKASTSSLLVPKTFQEKANSVRKDGALRDKDTKTPSASVNVVSNIPNHF